MDREKLSAFEEVTKPLVKWLNENGNPHSVIIIECDSARFLSGEIGIPITEYLKD